ncbi:uncharacterized protein LOC115448731 isoform X6 [Manduca sexta]|nr:uncharacterized protein LOC115448731 isoform X6 [Manduca sexta]XP_037298295.1 uncharacterized protein LOC115448731 isoform X6 [Manduca sexta]
MWIPAGPTSLCISTCACLNATLCGTRDAMENGDLKKLRLIGPTRCVRQWNKRGVLRNTIKGLFPFKLDRPFTIEVLVDEKETLFAVDGEHYCNYTHRNPSPTSAAWVQVAGIKNATLNIQKTSIYPVLSPPIQEVPLRASIYNPEGEKVHWRPNVIARLTNGLPEGYQVVIYGKLRPMLHSFAIDLMDEPREWPRPNIHVHANVRAHVESQRERQLVVLNTWFGGWGLERRQRTARLIPGTYTTFRIVRGPTDWLVFADDVLIGELESRASGDGVKAVRLRGDLFPEDIFICPSTSSPIGENS